MPRRVASSRHAPLGLPKKEKKPSSGTPSSTRGQWRSPPSTRSEVEAEEARQSFGHVVVIGGGLIGTEVAGGLSDGYEVTLLCAESRLLSKVIPAAAAEHATHALGCHVSDRKICVFCILL